MDSRSTGGEDNSYYIRKINQLQQENKHLKTELNKRKVICANCARSVVSDKLICKSISRQNSNTNRSIQDENNKSVRLISAIRPHLQVPYQCTNILDSQNRNRIKIGLRKDSLEAISSTRSKPSLGAITTTGTATAPFWSNNVMNSAIGRPSCVNRPVTQKISINNPKGHQFSSELLSKCNEITKQCVVILEMIEEIENNCKQELTLLNGNKNKLLPLVAETASWQAANCVTTQPLRQDTYLPLQETFNREHCSAYDCANIQHQAHCNQATIPGQSRENTPSSNLNQTDFVSLKLFCEDLQEFDTDEDVDITESTSNVTVTLHDFFSNDETACSNTPRPTTIDYDDLDWIDEKNWTVDELIEFNQELHISMLGFCDELQVISSDILSAYKSSSSSTGNVNCTDQNDNKDQTTFQSEQPSEFKFER